MAQLLKGSDGQLLKNAAGRLAKETEKVCTNCDEGIGPVSLDLTFSGIVGCTTCHTCQGSNIKVTTMPTVNGTWNVPYITECDYLHSSTPGTGLTFSIYNDSGCTDLSSTVSAANLRIGVVLGGAGDMTIFLAFKPVFALLYHFFYAVISNGADPPCSVWEGTHSNQITNCCQIIDFIGTKSTGAGSVTMVPRYC